MKNRYFLTFVLAFASFALFAQTSVWKLEKTLAAESTWSVDTNWTEGIPTETTKTVFNVPTAADCWVEDSAHAKQLVMGDNTDGSLIVIKDGGVIKTYDGWSAVGYNMSAELIVEAGGTLDLASHLWVGCTGEGAGTAIVEIAGTVNVGEMIGVNWGGSPDYTACEVYVTAGGELNLTGFNEGGSIKDNAFIDVSGGTITIPGDYKAAFETNVNAGKITAEGGDEAPTIEWQITGEDTVTVITSSTTVGLKDYTTPESTFSVYPNPAKDVVYLNNGMVADVQVYSITGQLVVRKNQASQIGVASLDPGIYVVKAVADNKQFIDKFIVE